MTCGRTALVIAALLLLMPSDARADWLFRPFAGAAVNAKHGFIDLEQTAGDSTPAIGGALGWRPSAIGIEFEVGVLPRFFEGPEDLVSAGSLTTIMGNVTWQLPVSADSSRVRAYVAGGAGVIRVNLEDVLNAYSSKTSLAAANVGGGVLFRLRPRFDINVDVRYFKSQYGDGGRGAFSEEFVSFTRLTGGLLLRF